MRALVLRDFWDLAVTELPDPRPGPGEVVVRTVATGICGSDIHGYTGENGRRRPGQVMGHETVGRVAELGAGTEGSGLAVGQPVTLNPVLSCGACRPCRSGRSYTCENRRVIGVDPALVSAFAELLAVPAGNVVPLPESMPIEYGALVEPLAVGYHAVRRGGVGPADAVLVLGGGPIGQAVTLGARRLGAERIVVSEPNPARRQLCADLGARVVGAGPDVAADIRAALSGAPTVAVDAVGITATVTTALSVVEPSGRVVLVGMGTPNVQLAAYDVSVAERSLIGSYCYSTDDFAETARWVGTAPAALARLVDARVPAEQANASFAALGRGETDASKILVFLDDRELAAAGGPAR